MKCLLFRTSKRSIAFLSFFCLTMGMVAVIFAIVNAEAPCLRILLFCCLFLQATALGINIMFLIRYKPNDSYEKLADKRLMLLRENIDLAYAHTNHPEVFHRKVCKLVNISNLRKVGVIPDLFLGKTRMRKYNKQKMPKTDYEFYSMLNSGFTPRELSIIYNYANPTSIYVKKYRLKTKIEKSVGKSRV